MMQACSPQWPSDDEIGDDIFETLHSGLAVALIATERRRLMTCRLDESLSVVVQRSKEKQYDHLPVTNDDRGDIVGLLHTRKYAQYASGTERVKRHFQPLSEGDLIGANASILDFIKDADSKPCRLIVSESEIIGLVYFVRPPEVTCPRGPFLRSSPDWNAQWRTRLEKSIQPIKIGCGCSVNVARKGSIEKSKKARSKTGSSTDCCLRNSVTSGIYSCTFFLLLSAKRNCGCQLEEIEELRNKVAHANDYATTLTEAQHVCVVVHNLLKLREEIVYVATRRSA